MIPYMVPAYIPYWVLMIKYITEKFMCIKTTCQNYCYYLFRFPLHLQRSLQSLLLPLPMSHHPQLAASDYDRHLMVVVLRG